MPRPNVLFVCSKNQWRSPTAEAIYGDDERISVRSRGTSRTSVRCIHSTDIKWADVILVMEDKHSARLKADFPGETKYTPIHVLDIPDDYRYMDDDLIAMIRSASDPIIDSLTATDTE